MQGKARFIFPIFLSGVMALLMTAFVTALNLGFPKDYLSHWMRAWVLAWPLAYCAAIIATPFAHRATQAIVTMLDGDKK